VQLCARGEAGLQARFVRNENLMFNATEPELQLQRGHGRTFCHFTPEMAEWADVIVLNRGLHPTPVNTFTRELDVMLRALRNLPPLPPGRPVRSRRIVFRSTHAPIPKCHPHRKISSVSLQHLVSTGPPEYHWDRLAGLNAIAECLSNRYGVSFVDVYYLSSFRPDAAVKMGDCVHSCLPGPVDEWSRLILSLLVHDGNSALAH